MSEKREQSPTAGRGARAPKRIVLRHISGSKANQVEEFPLAHLSQLTLGRDPTVEVKFDPERDDLVSREHARIEPDPSDSKVFLIRDLGSRNGTFVNRQKVSEKARVRPGDVIQLGPGGPELRFDLEPRSEHGPKPTRIPEGAAASSRLSESAAAASAGSPEGALGRPTVQRMIESSSTDTRRQLINVAAILVAILAVVAAILLYQGRRIRQQVREVEEIQARAPKQASEVLEASGGATVMIEFSWKLIFTPTGEQVYQRYREGHPAYLLHRDLIGNTSIRPWLITDSEDGSNEAIGNSGVGSGFVVTENGFVLTNRHLAANWHSAYDLKIPGRLYDAATREYLGTLYRDRDSDSLYIEVRTSRRDLGEEGLRYLENLRNWVPAKAVNIDGRLLKGKIVEGRLDYLDVTFPKTSLRNPARLVRVSDTADAALVKIDLPSSVNKVDLHDNYQEIKAGDPITVLGYSGVSRDVAVKVRSRDPLSPTDQWRTVPEPTVTPGHIARVLREQQARPASEQYDYWSAGDNYQLHVNVAGADFSGGPVFDDRGRVVGIYTNVVQGEVKRPSSVPIRYGLELMQISPVID